MIFSTPSFAYGSPGAGLSALGSLVALLAGLVLGVVGFVWYPIKRLLKSFGLFRPETNRK
jgi:hypothetical protein